MFKCFKYNIMNYVYFIDDFLDVCVSIEVYDTFLIIYVTYILPMLKF